MSIPNSCTTHPRSSRSYLGPVQRSSPPSNLPGAAEQLKSIDLALAGYDLSFIPRNWRSYDSQRAAAWNAAKPLARVVERYPDRAAEIESLAVSSRSSIADMRFLPRHQPQRQLDRCHRATVVDGRRLCARRRLVLVARSRSDRRCDQGAAFR